MIYFFHVETIIIFIHISKYIQTIIINRRIMLTTLGKNKEPFLADFFSVTAGVGLDAKGLP